MGEHNTDNSGQQDNADASQCILYLSALEDSQVQGKKGREADAFIE